jgi:hypothetical protein
VTKFGEASDRMQEEEWNQLALRYKKKKRESYLNFPVKELEDFDDLMSFRNK